MRRGWRRLQGGTPESNARQCGATDRPDERRQLRSILIQFWMGMLRSLPNPQKALRKALRKDSNEQPSPERTMTVPDSDHCKPARPVPEHRLIVEELHVSVAVGLVVRRCHTVGPDYVVLGSGKVSHTGQQLVAIRTEAGLIWFLPLLEFATRFEEVKPEVKPEASVSSDGKVAGHASAPWRSGS